MIKVKNEKAIKTLSRRSLKNAGKRNLVAVIAIALTTVMFTGLLTIGMSLMDYMEEQTMRQVGTMAHGGFKYLTHEQYDTVAADKEAKALSYNIYAGSATNRELKKMFTEVRYSEDDAAKWSFCYPEEGRMPQEYRELACGTAVLDALDLPHELGTQVPLSFEVNGKTYEDTFTLCGYWETDPIIPANEILLSKTYIHDVAPTPVISQYQQERPEQIAGYINVTLYFSSSWNIEGQIVALRQRCNFPPEISDGVNWAYGTSSVDADTVMMVCGVLLLIVVAGYLIIYNIFAISVSRDIHFYGLLKTVGTTGRQLKQLVHRQAALLALIGIPLGLVLGWAAGKLLMPVILMSSSYANAVQAMKVSFSPVIFIGGAVLSLVTLWISCLKPCRMAARVSPVDAVRWNEAGGNSRDKLQNSKAGKKRKASGKWDKAAAVRKSRKVTPYTMAAANLRRSPVKTVVVILSLTLSLTLLNTMVTVLEGYDEEKYIDERMPCDYILTDYTITQYASERNFESITPELTGQVASDPGMAEMGVAYYTETMMKVSETVKARVLEFAQYLTDQGQALYLDTDLQMLEENNVLASLYGAGGLTAQNIKVYGGTLDMEKFLSGDYVVLAPPTELDDEEETASRAFYRVGDKVPVDWPDGTKKEYEVLAIGAMDYAMGSRSGWVLGMELIVPSSEYLAHTPDAKGAMNLAVNCTDDEKGQALGQWLEEYCENSYSTTFESRETVEREFESMNNTISRVGGALSLILAMIAVLNFINSIVTSICIRQRELAMLQSVGMTRSQMRRMMIWEGLDHIFLGLALSAVASLAVGYGLGKTLETATWFFSWHPVIWPIAVSAPLLAALAAAVPALAFHSMNRQTIVERLRQVE